MGEESRPLLTHKQTITVTCEPSEQHEETEKKKELATRDTAVLPKYRQYAMLAILLTVHFSVLCSDSSLYPFYGTTAKRKGLVDSQIGLVYAVYEIVRCVAAPFYGVLVSLLHTCYGLTMAMHHRNSCPCPSSDRPDNPFINQS